MDMVGGDREWFLDTTLVGWTPFKKLWWKVPIFSTWKKLILPEICITNHIYTYASSGFCPTKSYGPVLRPIDVQDEANSKVSTGFKEDTKPFMIFDVRSTKKIKLFDEYLHFHLQS